jgi:hypothetical protein
VQRLDLRVHFGISQVNHHPVGIRARLARISFGCVRRRTDKQQTRDNTSILATGWSLLD